MERIENIGFGGLKLIQDTDAFCYGIDAVLLADFAYQICSSFKTAADLGTGNGIIPFILSCKNETAEFIGIELQGEVIELARRSCSLNGLEDRIRFVQADAAQLTRETIGDEQVDIVTCNPPYFPRGGGIPASSAKRFIARHETSAEVDDFVKAAAILLNGKGHFFMVHRPSRLVDIFCSCRRYSLEPKHIRYVAPRDGEIPNIVLLHCTAGGGRELRMMKQLCVYDNDGSYTDEIMQIYGRKQL